MRSVPSRLKSPAMAGLAAVLLLSAPLAAGWAGTSARAAEPAPATSASPQPAAATTALPEPTTAPEPASAPEPSAEPEPTMAAEPVTEPIAVPAPEPASALEPVAEPAAEPVAMMTGEPGPAQEAPTVVGADGCVYTYVEEEGLIVILDIAGCTEVVVPAQIEGLPVHTIGSLAGAQTMSAAATVTSLVLPDSLVAIGVAAFKDADALVTLDLGGGVQVVSGGAFQDSDALTSVTLPESVREVGERAFENSSALAQIDLGRVEVVRKLAFSGAAQVTELRIPASLKDARDTAFGNMPRLRSLLIEGNPSGFEKFTFLNSASLAEVEFHSRSSTATVANTIFLGANGAPKVYFRDGAFGLSCEKPGVSAMGGTQVLFACLYDVSVDTGAPLFTLIRNVREGAVLQDLPAPNEPEFMRFDGYVPALEDGVFADTFYVAQFVPIVPEPYTPSEDDLVEGSQGGFLVPESVTAGEVLTLVSDPSVEVRRSAPLEPSPARTSEPVPDGTEDPEPPVDPSEFVDVWMFSEPVELEILGGTNDEIRVQIPAGIEPGEHRVAIYTVTGDLLGWQPIAVLAAEGPAAPPTDGDGGGAGDGTGDGTGDSTGGDPNGDAGAGSNGGAAPAGASDIDELSETGAPNPALPLAGALALAVVGAALIAARRLTR